MAYKIAWHLLCTMIFKLEIPLTQNLSDRFRDWVLPLTAINWWYAKTSVFYIHLLHRIDIMPKCNIKWSMHKDSQWWCKVFQNTWQSQLDFKDRVFLWRLLSGALLVACTLKERHVTNGKCCRCKKKQETLKHAFWYRDIVNEWWHQLLCILLCIDNKLNRFNITFGSYTLLAEEYIWIVGQLRYWMLSAIWVTRNVAVFQNTILFSTGLPWFIIKTKLQEDAEALLDHVFHTRVKMVLDSM